MEKIEQSYKKSKNIIGIIQSCLILLLIVLIIFIMVNISRLQGTARVINYAGLVRGATQREVKLEITGNPDDELIKYLDDVLNDLKYQNGQYNLVNLHDNEYHDKLQILSDYWEELKKENINKIIEEITPADSVVCKKDNAKIIVELLTTNDEDRAEQITKYLYNEKKR